VLNGIGVVFNVPWPPAYRRVLSYVNVLDIDLPNLMPIGCLMEVSFYQRLLMRTAVPFGMTALLEGLALVLSSYAARRPSKAARRLPMFVSETCDNLAFFVRPAKSNLDGHARRICHTARTHACMCVRACAPAVTTTHIDLCVCVCLSLHVCVWTDHVPRLSDLFPGHLLGTTAASQRALSHANHRS
jgi:hypothetical protein